MKILLVGNYRYSHQQSMQRFADLMRELLTAAGHHIFMWHFCAPAIKAMGSAFPSQIDT